MTLERDWANALEQINRLTEDLNYWKIADNHHQEVMAQMIEENARLRAALERIIADVTPAANNGATGAISVHDIARKALANEQKP